MKESQNNKNNSSLKMTEKQKKFLERIRKSIEEDKDLTGEELEEKYKVLSNDWD